MLSGIHFFRSSSLWEGRQVPLYHSKSIAPCEKEDMFSSPVWMYRKSYCTTPGVAIVIDSGGMDKTYKFYVKSFLKWWARRCQASYSVSGQVLLN